MPIPARADEEDQAAQTPTEKLLILDFSWIVVGIAVYFREPLPAFV